MLFIYVHFTLILQLLADPSVTICHPKVYEKLCTGMQSMVNPATLSLSPGLYLFMRHKSTVDVSVYEIKLLQVSQQ